MKIDTVEVELKAKDVEDAVRTCVKEFEALCIANRVIETDCIYCEREPNETAYCHKWHKYLDHGCECKEVALKDVVECSKLLDIADKQEQLGYIQTADVLRRIAKGVM